MFTDRMLTDRSVAVELLRELLQRLCRLGEAPAIEAARKPIGPADLRGVDLRDEGYAIRRQLEQRRAAVCGVPHELREALGLQHPRHPLDRLARETHAPRDLGHRACFAPGRAQDLPA